MQNLELEGLDEDGERVQVAAGEWLRDAGMSRAAAWLLAVMGGPLQILDVSHNPIAESWQWVNSRSLRAGAFSFTIARAC